MTANWSPIIGMISAAVLAIAGTGSCSPAADPTRQRSADTQHAFAEAVEKLGNDSYRSRQTATRKLLNAAKSANSQSVQRRASLEALRAGLHHSTLEVRVQSLALLQQIKQAEFDRELQRLLNPRVDAETVQLPGWQRFSKMAGDDRSARNLFARMFGQYSSLIIQVDAQFKDASVEPAKQTSMLDGLDPYRIKGDDAVRWAVLLSSDVASVEHNVSEFSARLVVSLSNSGLGPKISDQRDAAVIRQLIRHWLATHNRDGLVRERLLIAMRFGCQQRAAELCDQIFADPRSSASSQVTAMLSAAVLRRSDLESLLMARLDDDRTAHVWQLIATRQTRIRTQVRDVALALLLHRRGIDPRTAGFEELQADPLLVFRDHSLGFPSDATRQSAYDRATQLLGIAADGSPSAESSVY